jgi:hypothetical protein
MYNHFMMKSFLTIRYLFLPFLCIFLLQTMPRLWSDSAMRDEAWDLTNGYCYWTQGEVRNQSNYFHTPFAHALQALPLLSMNLTPPPSGLHEESRAYYFCSRLNREKSEKMFLLARSVTLLLSVGVGWLLFIAASSLGPLVAFFALFLWAFDPTFLAWSILVKTDVPAAFFSLAAVLVFLKARRLPNNRWSFLTGILLGMAVTTKMSCLGLIPACWTIEFLSPKSRPLPWRRWIFILVGFTSWFYLLYAPGIYQSGSPWTPFHQYLQLFQNSSLIRKDYHAFFFLGHATRPMSFVYYGTMFFLKSTLPYFVLCLLGAILLVTRKIRTENWVWIFPVFLAGPLLAFPMGSFRYLLPAQTFLILLSALAAQWLWDLPSLRGIRFSRYLVILLFLSHGLSVCLSFPRHISYFNDAIPREKRMHLLGDNEFDTGQDWKRLAATAKERGWKNIKLASESMMDPSLYGVSWSFWTEQDLKGPQSGWVYVTSVAFLQSAPIVYPWTYPIAMSWVRRLPPTMMVGDTLLIHEIPGSPVKDVSTPINSLPFFIFPPPTPKQTAAP